VASVILVRQWAEPRYWREESKNTTASTSKLDKKTEASDNVAVEH